MGHYMTKEERIILQTLLNEKKPVSYIARKLGCCRQTVYNEIRRGQYLHNYGYYDKLRYSADKGQQIHDYNQTAKGRPLKIGSDHAFAAFIEHKIIVDRYSPAAALAAARKYPFATRIRPLIRLVIIFSRARSGSSKTDMVSHPCNTNFKSWRRSCSKKCVTRKTASCPRCPAPCRLRRRSARPAVQTAAPSRSR